MKLAALLTVWIIALFGIMSLADYITRAPDSWDEVAKSAGVVAHKINVACGI